MARESQISKWNSPSGLLRLQRLAMHGLTQAEICEQIGVPVRTFRRWCTQDPHIKQAISVGAEAALASVENALFKKAQSGDLGAGSGIGAGHIPAKHTACAGNHNDLTGKIVGQRKSIHHDNVLS